MEDCDQKKKKKYQTLTKMWIIYKDLIQLSGGPLIE